MARGIDKGTCRDINRTWCMVHDPELCKCHWTFLGQEGFDSPRSILGEALDFFFCPELIDVAIGVSFLKEISV
jgi:hypothetical protein